MLVWLAGWSHNASQIPNPSFQWMHVAIKALKYLFFDDLEADPVTIGCHVVQDILINLHLFWSRKCLVYCFSFSFNPPISVCVCVFWECMGWFSKWLIDMFLQTSKRLFLLCSFFNQAFFLFSVEKGSTTRRWQYDPQAPHPLHQVQLVCLRSVAWFIKAIMSNHGLATLLSHWMVVLHEDTCRFSSSLRISAVEMAIREVQTFLHDFVLASKGHLSLRIPATRSCCRNGSWDRGGRWWIRSLTSCCGLLPRLYTPAQTRRQVHQNLWPGFDVDRWWSAGVFGRSIDSTPPWYVPWSHPSFAYHVPQCLEHVLDVFNWCLVRSCFFGSTVSLPQAGWVEISPVAACILPVESDLCGYIDLGLSSWGLFRSSQKNAQRTSPDDNHAMCNASMNVNVNMPTIPQWWHSSWSICITPLSRWFTDCNDLSWSWSFFNLDSSSFFVIC